MGNPKSQANDELVSASHLLPRLMAAFHPFPPSASRSPLSKRQTVRYCRLVEDLIAQGILELLARNGRILWDARHEVYVDNPARL